MPSPTPDWARIRFAYEHSDRPVEDICADYGISSGTLRLRMRRWNWTRRRPPIPRVGPAPLTPALAVAKPTTVDPGDCGDERISLPAFPLTRGGIGGVAPSHTESDAPPPSYSRFIAQEARAEPAARDAAPLSERLRGAIDRIMPAIESTLATLASGALQPRQMELAARSLGTLTRTLRELNGLLDQQHAADEPYEERDMNAFRLSLAAQMEAMIRQREDEIPRVYHEAWQEFAAQVAAESTGESREGQCLMESAVEPRPSDALTSRASPRMTQE